MNSHPYLTSMPHAALERRPKQFQKVTAKTNEEKSGEEVKDLPSVRNRLSALLPEASEADKENKLETVRKRYRCEDYMETQELKLQEMEGALDGHSNKLKQATQPPQSKEEDKQIEYFKSEQYKKYLQALTETHGKYDLLKGVKENRNNNVYLGKGDRKQYIQNIIKTKEVLPRVCLPKFENIQPKSEEIQPKVSKKQEYQHQHFRKGEITTKHIDEESPIKCTAVFDTMPKREKLNETIGLQPVCNQRKQQQFRQDIKMTKHTIYKQQFPLEANNFTPRQKTPQQKQPQNNAAVYAKYMNQEKCMDIITERYPTRKDKSSKKPILRYKIQEKQNSPIILTPQSSKHYSISSSPQKNPNINIYDVSFKIQKPNPSKHTYHQPKSPLPQKTAKPLTQRQQEKVCHRSQHTRHHIFTEWNDNNLHYSHTNSTTKGEPQKPHKISLISKSKLKF